MTGEELLDGRHAMLLAPRRVFHDEAAGPAEDGVVRVERRPEGAAAVARRGMDVDLLERRFTENAAVGDAVQRNAAGEAEPPEARLAMGGARHRQQNFLGHQLDAGGDVRIMLV